MQNVKYICSFVTGYIKNIKRRHSRTKKNYFYIRPDFSTWFILSCLATKILLDRDDLDKEVLRSGVGVVRSKLDDSLLFDADEVLEDIFSEHILLDKDDILGDDIVKSRSSTAELIHRDDLDFLLNDADDVLEDLPTEDSLLDKDHILGEFILVFG